jgi:aspartate/methionine/tyrosine aminotransferase
MADTNEPLASSPAAPAPDGWGAFRRVPRTGVIYVSSEAAKRGFSMASEIGGSEGWCNLGQGQPDTSDIPGAPKRLRSIPIETADLDYAPVAGLWELREAVADMVNRTHRKGMKSQYSAENVAIQGGGRVAVMRACAAVAPIHLGHFLPDYTAYEELLDVFRRFQPIPILLDPKEGYAFGADDLHREIMGRGLGAILMSNPCNPTGKLVGDEALAEWAAVARNLGCALLMDEFYSHYIWTEGPKIVSAAAHVEDVDRDPIVIFDGLTKNWRYPGFRVSWVLGPKALIQSIASAGSFLDGGGSAPMQRAAIDLLSDEHVVAETDAIRASFGEKRHTLMAGLRKVGVHLDIEPEGTFYAWGDVSGLPEGMNTGHDFFQRALDRRVITVPGHFFDVNPGKRRMGRPSRFRGHVRFSFGPAMPLLQEALTRIEAMVREG